MKDWINKLAETERRGDTCVLVTVVNVKGSAPREIGARMIVDLTGAIEGTIGGGHLERLAIEKAATLMNTRTAVVESFPLGAKTGQCCGGAVDLMFEPMGSAPILYIFGAGHVGQSVAQVMECTRFSVHLIDERDDWIGSSRIGPGVKRHPEGWDHFVHRAQWDAERVFCVIMTHQHDLDFEILCELFKRPARYIGLIGSHAKWNRFRDRLAGRGYDESVFARVQCPIGDKTGGKSPAEIAISVGAELLRQSEPRS